MFKGVWVDILFDILSQWLLQFRFSMRIQPRKLMFCTLSITVFPIFIIGEIIIICFVWNTVYSNFLIFRDNLFTTSHSLILDSYMLNLVSTFLCGVFRLNTFCRILDNVVSSAYIIMQICCWLLTCHLCKWEITMVQGLYLGGLQYLSQAC